MHSQALPDTEAQQTPGHGRHAGHPKEIPSRGWRDILTRVKTEIGSDHVTLVSAGLAMYALLAVFPGLAAAVALYGLFASPAQVLEHMQAFSGILPPGTWEIFKTQLQTIAGQAQGSLTLAALGGLALSLVAWSGALLAAGAWVQLNLIVLGSVTGLISGVYYFRVWVALQRVVHQEDQPEDVPRRGQ